MGVTVRDYLDGESNLSNKLEETQWFLALVEDVARECPVDRLSMAVTRLGQSQHVGVSGRGGGSGVVHRRFVWALAKTWFHFDAWASRRRPVRSWQRLRREMEDRTWILARATVEFLDAEARSLRGAGGGAGEGIRHDKHEREIDREQGQERGQSRTIGGEYDPSASADNHDGTTGGAAPAGPTTAYDKSLDTLKGDQPPTTRAPQGPYIGDMEGGEEVEEEEDGLVDVEWLVLGEAPPSHMLARDAAEEELVVRYDALLRRLQLD